MPKGGLYLKELLPFWSGLRREINFLRRKTMDEKKVVILFVFIFAVIISLVL
ncbi:MAG: hypothetical protein J6B00_00460 [Alphaproteobacteria bacterium]|nr:hypothetical protein [Alphaproteobacteria bacterium]MBP3687422.1 hypothetical protein [Alphaproteobacteria bacterium]